MPVESAYFGLAIDDVLDREVNIFQRVEVDYVAIILDCLNTLICSCIDIVR